MMDILIEQLKRHEGFRSKPYKCSAGKLTIGYGRNLDDVGINQSEALELLRQDVARARKDVLKHISGADLLDDVRLNVLINMCFNLGIYKLLLFRKTLRAVQDLDFDKAAEEMLNSVWANQVGVRAAELAE
jgi:lysozyme